MTEEDLVAIRTRFEKYRQLGAPDIAALLAEIKRLRTEKTETALQRLIELGQEMDNE